MDGSDPDGTGRGGGGRALLAVGVVLGLLAVVAVASSRDVTIASGGSRRPTEQVLDTLITLLIVLMAITSVFFLIGTVLGRGLGMEERRKRRSQRGNALAWLIALTLFLGVALLAARAGSDGRRPRLPNLITGPAGDGSAEGAGGGYEPEFATIPILIVSAVIVTACVAWWLSIRARRRVLPLPPLEETLADVLDETVDDLRALDDPRAAVIAAYARLERALAAAGVPRRPAEAPEEYLQRVLINADVSAAPASRLTELFATAKFSSHEVGTGMRDDAIEALVAVRDELREAAERREQARREALAIASGETAHS